jgi:hypothetical protein
MNRLLRVFPQRTNGFRARSAGDVASATPDQLRQASAEGVNRLFDQVSTGFHFGTMSP